MNILKDPQTKNGLLIIMSVVILLQSAVLFMVLSNSRNNLTSEQLTDSDVSVSSFENLKLETTAFTPEELSQSQLAYTLEDSNALRIYCKDQQLIKRYTAADNSLKEFNLFKNTKNELPQIVNSNFSLRAHLPNISGESGNIIQTKDTFNQSSKFKMVIDDLRLNLRNSTITEPETTAVTSRAEIFLTPLGDYSNLARFILSVENSNNQLSAKLAIETYLNFNLVRKVYDLPVTEDMLSADSKSFKLDRLVVIVQDNNLEFRAFGPEGGVRRAQATLSSPLVVDSNISVHHNSIERINGSGTVSGRTNIVFSGIRLYNCN